MSDDLLAMSLDEPKMETAALWCLRLSEGELDEREWAEFEAWLDAPGHADLFQEAALVWQTSGALGDLPEVIALRTKALDRFRRSNELRWLRVPPRRTARTIGYAAALLLTLGVTLFWYGNRPQEYATGIGERQLAILKDGSHLSLDAATAVNVRIKDESRQIELVEGRAKFDVAKDRLRPFTVAAGDKVIVAVGTSFSVELVDGKVRVILYEGQVEVRDRSDTGQVAAATARRRLLRPGNELVGVIGSNAPPQIVKPDLSQSLSWEHGLINFDGEPLASAVERMNRYSSRRLKLGDHATGTIRIEGIFKAGDLDAFVEGVTTLHPVRYRTIDDEIVLEGK